MQRLDAKMAGVAYLSYVVLAMSSGVLFGRASAGDDITQVLTNLNHMIWTARATVLLDLLQSVCALVLAVTLYQMVKAVNPTIALLAMLFRVGEGLAGFLPLLSKLELIRFATTPLTDSADAPRTLSIASDLLNRPDDGFSQFCFVVGGFLFAVLFLNGHLIPQWLARVGVLTIGAQLICVPLHIAGVVPNRIINFLWLPILLYEVPLGIWFLAGKARPMQIAPAPTGGESHLP